MPWTALHAALGVTHTELTYNLIDDACANKVEERTDLDWKLVLPNATQKPDWQSELAKDIAAMANTGGGMIVYGVRDVPTGNTSAADGIEPVGAVSESELQTIRHVAGNLIYPPVVGLDFHRLHPQGRPDDGVLALIIPDSTEMPHLIHPPKQRDYFAAPWRDGPHTSWMVERQLASAYASRDKRARDQAEQLSDVWNSAVAKRTSEGILADAWILAVAVPERPRRQPRDLTADIAAAVMNLASRHRVPARFGSLDLVNGASIRRGLRRYYRASARTITATDAKPRARIDLYGDASISVAFTRAGSFLNESPITSSGHVAIDDIETTGFDLIAMLVADAAIRQPNTNYAARIGVVPHTELFRRKDPHLAGHYQSPHESPRILDYQPIDGAIIGTRGVEALVRSCAELIDDATSQAGIPLETDVDQVVKFYS